MDRQRLVSLIKRVWVSVGIGATLVFVGWSLIAFRASAEARAAARSDAAVASQRGDGVWRFTPLKRSSTDSIGLVFFPGGLVDPTAYAPLARAVAESGYPVILMELPRRGAFGGAEDPELLGRTQDMMRSGGGPRRWIVAGHSRGAVVASELASRRVPGVVGLLLAGTTHPRDVDLSGLGIPVTKLVGTRDGIAPERKSEANRHLLPPATRWVRIAGGNHSQFGWYGFQPGDRFAETPAAHQHSVMIEAVLALLRGARAVVTQQSGQF